MKEELLKKINNDLTKENDLLLILLLILTILFIIWLCIAIKEKTDLKKENAKLEQQVIDYKWQLEQVQYIIKCKEWE